MRDEKGKERGCVGNWSRYKCWACGTEPECWHGLGYARRWSTTRGGWRFKRRVQARLSSRHADCKNAPGKKVDKSINKHAQGSLLIMTFDVFQSLSYPNQRTFITIWIVDVLSRRTQLRAPRGHSLSVYFAH